MADGIVRVAPGETARAVEAIAADGCVVLERAVSADPLTALRRRMDRDTQDLLRYCAIFHARGMPSRSQAEGSGSNPRHAGHLQQGPPPFADYVFAEVAMNPAANAVAEAVFDQRPQLTFYNGNTNCPGSVRQHLHMDGRHSTAPGEPVAPTAALVVNIPPGPMHDGNGAIELWPGSHRVGVYGDHAGIPAAMEARRRTLQPPVNPPTDPGDVLIRDVRLWHRGVPNLSNRPRHMIALILSSPSAAPRRRLPFGRGCERALEGRGADANAQYLDGPIDYLFGPSLRIYRGLLQARKGNGT